MKEDKAHVLRKSLTVICLILIFVTAGLFLIATQLKTVTLEYHGNRQVIKTLASDVDSFLLQNKIVLGEKETVSPDRKTAIQNGLEIKIYAEQALAQIDLQAIKDSYVPMVAKIEEVIETIPYTEEKKNNPTVDNGTQNIVQEGKEGQKSIKYMVRYQNNEEIERAQISSDVVTQAQNKVIEVGTKIAPIVSRSAIAQSVNAQTADAGFRAYNIKLPVEQQKFAYNISKKYGIQYELFLAVMSQESGFNAGAVGGGNSYGLCQIHVSNHASLRSKLGISNFLDPYDNMTAGAYLLAQYFSTARKVTGGDTVEVYALNSYNMGEGIYFNNCYSKGIVNRGYSNSVIAKRNRLVSTGSL